MRKLLLLSSLCLASASLAGEKAPDAKALAPKGPVIPPFSKTAAGKLIVHEWGTFTNFAGSDGVYLDYRPLVDSDLPSEVASLIQARRLEPASLHLEVTESLVMADPERAVEVLRKLRELGVSVALDDFGTGYSSLGYLKNLPVDELKLDRSFVAGVASNARDAAIVRATVQLAQAVDMRTVAEGVETVEAWEVLNELGCDRAQGYLLSKPAPASELTGWLAERGGAGIGVMAPGGQVAELAS